MTITPETLPQHWKYAVRKRYWTKKKAVIRKLVTPISQILFFLCFLVLCYGILFTKSQDLLRTFLMKQPELVNHWLALEEWLMAGAVTQTQQLIRLLLLLYVPPVALSTAAALLVVLLYHPIAPKLPEEPQGQARELWVMSQHIRNAMQKKPSNVFGFCGILFGILAAGFVVFFLLYYARNPEISNQLHAHGGQAPLYFVLAVFASLICYWLFNLPMRLLLQLLYGNRVPKDFIAAAQEFYDQSREKAPEPTEV